MSRHTMQRYEQDKVFIDVYLFFSISLTDQRVAVHLEKLKQRKRCISLNDIKILTN